MDTTLHHLPPKDGDAIGHLLARAWAIQGAPGQVFEVVERSDGFIGVGDACEYFAPPEQWPERERKLLTACRGRVLDVGCGAGRHLAHLQGQGHTVLGIDSSPGAVRICQEQGIAAKTGTSQNLPCGDSAFDTILALGANLGLLGGRDASLATLREWARVAAPGAQILATGRDPYASQGEIHRAYHQANRTAGRMAGQLRIRIRSQALASPYFDYLYASLTELTELLEPSPWTLRHTIEDPHGGYGVVLALRD
ncbi:class I SAM-dependent methyltransferase [Streptomyces sp. NPDC055897]